MVLRKMNKIIAIGLVVLGCCLEAEARSIILGGSTSQRGNALSRHYALTPEEIRNRVKAGMKFPAKGDVYTTSETIPMFCKCKESDGKYRYYEWGYYGSVGSCYSDTQTYQALKGSQKTKKQADDFVKRKVADREAFVIQANESLVIKKVLLPTSSPSSSGGYDAPAKQRKYASAYTKYLNKAIILVERVDVGEDEPRAGFVTYADLKHKGKK